MCLIVAVCPNTEVVVIHDAVRPIIDEDHLWNITQAAVNHGVRLISSMLKIGMYWSGFLPVLNLTESWHWPKWIEPNCCEQHEKEFLRSWERLLWCCLRPYFAPLTKNYESRLVICWYLKLLRRCKGQLSSLYCVLQLNQVGGRFWSAADRKPSLVDADDTAVTISATYRRLTHVHQMYEKTQFELYAESHRQPV